MTNVLLLGAGTIGRMIATLLTQTGDYVVRVADSDAEALRRLNAKFGVETVLLNASNEEQLRSAMNGMHAVISALTFSLNTAVARVANVERMQMLIESPSRIALQRFLAQWLPALHGLRRERSSAEQRVLRWAVDVDPLSI